MSYDFSNFKIELGGVEEWLAKEYSQVHTGRATPTLLDSIQIESYGAMGPIKNSASIAIEDARTLRIAPWDKTLIKNIEKAINAANIGLSVSSDDAGVRATFPMLTTENREKLVKVLKEKMEDARVRVRKARDSALGALREAKLPEDDEHRGKEEIQKYTDEANKKLEAIFSKKENEVMN